MRVALLVPVAGAVTKKWLASLPACWVVVEPTE
jgi:hypothetical protein